MNIEVQRKKLLFLLFYIISMQFFAQINRPPSVVYDVDTVDFNTTLTVPAPGVLINDSDADGDTITVIQFLVNGTSFNAGDTAVLAEGSITINADGSYIFIPTNGYDGYVPDIFYVVSDGIDTTTTVLYLTVEMDGSLLEFVNVYSCNQGYTSEGYYQIYYTIQVRNRSITRGYHDASNIEGIQVFDDLNSVFGDCIFEIERQSIFTSNVNDFLGGLYPSDWSILSWDDVEFDQTDATPGAQGLINAGSVGTAKLYPRQSLYLTFCVKVEPFCNGRPNPSPSGSGINFDNIVNVTTTTDGSLSGNLEITDFHTSDTTVAANLFVPEESPIVNFDGTYDYTDTVIITNDGVADAQNVNFNLGLGNFIDNGINFTTLTVTQVGIGTPLTVNPTYNGDTDTFLLAPNQVLPAGETIYLQIYYVIAPITSTANTNVFSQMLPSMTYGVADGYDETTLANLRRLSFVTWSDSQGVHSDRYYFSTTDITDNPEIVGEVASSTNQCQCLTKRKEFIYVLNLTSTKTITNIAPAPDGIPEHKEVTFVIRGLNDSSSNVRLENVTLQDDLSAICTTNVLSVSTPVILGTSTAETNPTINAAYNGTSDINLFNGTSGIINPDEFIDVEIKVIIADDCFGTNTSSFSGNDPLGVNLGIGATVSVSIFSDSDNDGITDINDLDDDNDGIPDLTEYNGLDPLADADNDNIPDYRDTDFGVDVNADGIVDIFDFDMDGIPNHFDLDSDNDSIYDIVEAGNAIQDTDNDGITNNGVGANGLDDLLENNDTSTANINYVLQKSDTDIKPDYLDIDSDNDGIVDVIEAQSTNAYINPVATDTNANGILDVYENLGNPVDTDGDTIPDYLDTNSDDDFYSDLIEAWDINNDGTANTVASNIDSDNDGLDDAFDNDDTQINPTNAQVPTDFPNLDDPTTLELDWREALIITVSIADATIVEGGILNFTVSVDNFSPTDIVIEITTTDDTAISPDDFTPPITDFTITILAGQLIATTTIDIQTIQDEIYEADESFILNGNVTSNNTINNPTAIGTITNDDSMPIITILDAQAEEGNDLLFEISLDRPSSTPIIIDFTTNDGTAIDGQDYTGVAAFSFEISALTTQIDFPVITIDDAIYELIENMNLTGIVSSENTQNTFFTNIGTILDNEPEPTITINNPEVIEGNTLVFSINTDVLSHEPISFNIFTNNGTAIQPNDYTAISISAILPALSESIQVMVQTMDDLIDEDNENMILTAIITSFNTLNLQAEGIGTIIDNDKPNLFSPNGDGRSDYFEIDGLQRFPNFTIQIFDRYGSMVFDYANKGNPTPFWWNGTFKGNPVPEGVYYYVLDYNDNLQKPVTGFIQLIR